MYRSTYQICVVSDTRIVFVHHPLPNCPFEISQNSEDSLIMLFSWGRHLLAKVIDDIGDVGTRVRQVYELANKLAI